MALFFRNPPIFSPNIGENRKKVIITLAPGERHHRKTSTTYVCKLLLTSADFCKEEIADIFATTIAYNKPLRKMLFANLFISDETSWKDP
jgi:hypothetical protein